MFSKWKKNQSFINADNSTTLLMSYGKGDSKKSLLLILNREKNHVSISYENREIFSGSQINYEELKTIFELNQLDFYNFLSDSNLICPTSNKLNFENSAFVTTLLANTIDLTNEILAENSIKSGIENNKIYFYNEGIWQEDVGEMKTRRIIQTKAPMPMKWENEAIHQIKTKSRISITEFDKRVELVAVQNGVLNLLTRELLNFSPDYLLTFKLNAKFNPEAKGERFKQFVNEIVVKEDTELLKEICGYTLWRKYYLHNFFIWTGKGRNGKGTLSNIIRYLFGIKQISAVSMQELSNPNLRFVTGELFGKMINLCSDDGRDALKDTRKIKMLCSGEDTIMAEFKRENPFNFLNYAKLLFLTNEVPKVYDNSDGFFDRMIIVDFPFKFEGCKRDDKLFEKLTQEDELSAILNWMVEGLNQVQLNGQFSYGYTTKQNKLRHEIKSNPLFFFLDNFCELEANATINKPDFYALYEQFCNMANVNAISANKLARPLKSYDQAIYDGRNKVNRFWLGITWKNNTIPDETEILKITQNERKVTVVTIDDGKKIQSSPEIYEGKSTSGDDSDDTLPHSYNIDGNDIRVKGDVGNTLQSSPFAKKKTDFSSQNELVTILVTIERIERNLSPEKLIKAIFNLGIAQPIAKTIINELVAEYLKQNPNLEKEYISKQNYLLGVYAFLQEMKEVGDVLENPCEHYSLSKRA